MMALMTALPDALASKPNTHISRQTDLQRGNQRNSQTDRHISRHTHTKDKLTGRQTVTNRHTIF